MGSLPVMINLPPTNELEQSRNIFRTGNSNVQPRNYVWSDLATVDRHVEYFLSNVNLYQQDMDVMMVASSRLQAAGVDNLTASRRIACDWVRDQASRWVDWLPALCQPGSFSGSLVTCVPCAAGSYCAGGFAEPVLCPAGAFCPANASRPAACSDQSSTRAAGSRSAADCVDCVSGHLRVAGACRSVAVTMAAIAVPLTVFACLAAAAGFRYGAAAALSPAERLMRKRIARLRRDLLLTREDGFLIDSEWTLTRGRAAGAKRVLQRADVETAVRLELLRWDAEERLLDAFCTCVYGAGGKPAERLRAWLLRLSDRLLDPEERVGGGSARPRLLDPKEHPPPGHASGAPAAVGAASFSGGSCSSVARVEWHDDEQLARRRAGLWSMSSSYMESSVSLNAEADVAVAASQRARFAYFCQKLSGLQV